MLRTPGSRKDSYLTEMVGVPPTIGTGFEDFACFLIEDVKERFYPIYNRNPRIIRSLVGECFVGFEYYAIGKDLKWLLCENHHSELIRGADFKKIS